MKKSKLDHYPANGEKAVMVTTQHRGVFFGYATEWDGEIVKLKRARLCIA